MFSSQPVHYFKPPQVYTPTCPHLYTSTGPHIHISTGPLSKCLQVHSVYCPNIHRSTGPATGPDVPRPNVHRSHVHIYRSTHPHPPGSTGPHIHKSTYPQILFSLSLSLFGFKAWLLLVLNILLIRKIS